MPEEHPILFTPKNVKRILSGTKTQTRRVIRPQPLGYDPSLNDDGLWEWCDDLDHLPEHVYRCPYGQPGDVLWVRETWAVVNSLDDTKPRDIPHEARVWYQATDLHGTEYRANFFGKWRPSIFMPKWMCRIRLDLLDVRVQRVQEICGEDAVAEGINVDYQILMLPASIEPEEWYDPEFRDDAARYGFSNLWDHINEDRSYGWDDNPWVWALTFQIKEVRRD